MCFRALINSKLPTICGYMGKTAHYTCFFSPPNGFDPNVAQYKNSIQFAKSAPIGILASIP
jgi:hypothetical protein